jgi:uncharacterized Zn ribbon protein
MQDKFTHNCIKCSLQYTDNDPEAYYCNDCNEQRKAIAKEIDKKIALKPKRDNKSELQTYDEIRRTTGANFVNIKDLGITL